MPSVVLSQPQAQAVAAGDQVEVSFGSIGVELSLGARGPTGPAGPSGGSAITAVAGEALGGHRAVRHDADGEMVYADPATAAGAQVAGVTMAAAVMGDQASAQVAGELELAGWNWAEGPIYLGALGTLTQVAPTTGYLVVVGLAAGPDRMVVAPTAPIKIS
jgi:hypothetical protein